jgi:hypothetical protein
VSPRHGVVLAVVALFGCSSPEDGASARKKLVGTYTLVAAEHQPTARKDLLSSVLRLSRDGMFTQQCRYKSGKSDSAIGTWSYSNRRAQFSVFKDCAGVLPAGKGADMGRALAVDFDSPTKILLSSHAQVRYERRGPP